MICDNMNTVGKIEYAKLKLENQHTSTSIKQIIPGTIGICQYNPLYGSTMYSEVLGLYLITDYPGTLEWKSNTRAGLSKSSPLSVKSRDSISTLKNKANALVATQA